MRSSTSHLVYRVAIAAGGTACLAVGQWPAWFTVAMGVLLLFVVLDGVVGFRRIRRVEERGESESVGPSPRA